MRDLMFYIEAQTSIAKSPLKEEIQDGNVIVQESNSGVDGAAGGAKPVKRGKKKGKR